MGVKSLCFGLVVFSFYFTSVVSKKHAMNTLLCVLEESKGLPCTQCDFLTFGQDEDGSGLVSYFCPNDILSDGKKDYCCYDPLRRPFCCNIATYAFTGCLWIAVVVLVIGAVAKFIKCLLL